MTVLKAISECQKILAETGVKKTSARGLNYSFRSIDDLYTAVGRALPQTGLVVLPTVLDAQVQERQSKQGGLLSHARVTMQYDFRCIDGEDHVQTKIIGEAMDAGDKAFSKAQSMAFKTMILQTFCIPLEGEIDPDAQNYDTETAPPLPDKIEADIRAKAEEGTEALQEYWMHELSKEDRQRFGTKLNEFKQIASGADAAAHG